MLESWKTRWWSVVVFAGLVPLGCMSERAPINRVQPDYIDKNDLIPYEYQLLTAEGQTPDTVTPQVLAKEPVFYTQTTLIAKPTTTGFTGLTSYGEADKIRWQVTETTLIARQAYEYIKNAPGGSAGIGQVPQTGDVVAVFKINSHFDIRHDYNPTTGEQLNVIVENSADRPWYQRQYMHVDWSQNLITGYNSIFLEQEWNNQLQAEPVPVFVNTPNDPNAPVFEYSGAGADRKLTYFDVVNQAVLHPETAFYSYSEHPGDTTSYQAIPVCDLGEGETDCAPAEVTLRVAFRRVDPTRDYEPASLTESLPNEDGTLASIPHLNMERFGFFDVMRLGWDTAQNATLDTQRIHFAARHNLWIRHHAPMYGENTTQLCNFDADCKPVSGAPEVACRIGNTPADAGHRGVCAPLALEHQQNDPSCTTDDDCRQYSDTGGVSRTSLCDQKTSTCGERYHRCSTDADCAAVDAQSTCDLAVAYTRADNRGLCLLPFRQRQVRQVAYHESNNYPDYMQPVTEQIVKEWNDAFAKAVQAARRHECELTQNVDPTMTDLSANPCNDPKIVGLDTGLGGDAQFPFVGCHSPVWGTDKGLGQHSQADVEAAHQKGWDLPVCGPQGTAARLGDLRYSMMGAITDQDSQGYWGLANIAADPETGEMVAGRGAVWQTITDYYAGQLVEYVRILNGDLDPGAVTNGEDLLSSMKALGAGQTPSAAILDGPLKKNGLTDIAAAKAGIEKLKLPDAGWLKPGGLPLLSQKYGTTGALDRVLQRMLDGRMLGDGTSIGATRLGSLVGTQIESMMMNSQQSRLAATPVPDDGAVLPGTLDQASPLRQQSQTTRHAIERIKAKLANYQCGMEAEFNDDLLLGLALRLAKGAPISASDPNDAPVAFGRDWNFQNGGTLDYNLIRQYATQFIHHGVLAHEIGHSLGQRHNFTASADAINYNDNYWAVRAKGHPAGLRPRYEYVADPNDGNFYSPDEISGRVDEWSYSSVMDYKGLNEDAHGIGRYDYAFIKNGYVNLVEAFKRVKDYSGALTYSINTAGNGNSSMLDLRDWSGGGPVHGLHYTQIPALFGTRADGTPDIQADNRYDVFLNETQSTPVDGWGSPNFTNTTADNHVLVPYRFDSDERAGLVWQDQHYDAGPDPYESLHYVTERMINYYFMNSYARLRTGFSTHKYVERIWGRYLEQLRQTTQILQFDLLEYQDFFAGSPGWNTYLTDSKEYGGFTNMAAMNESVDTMVAILTMPELGVHTPQPQLDGSLLMSPDPNQAVGLVNIKVNDGRAFESDWRNDAGFWWYDMLDRAGAYYDKVMMLQALTDPELLLLSRDTPTDIRLFQLNFYTMFPDQMIRLFGGLLAEDTEDFAPIYDTSASSIARTHVSTLTAAPQQRGRTIDASHVAIDPQDHFTIQLWSAVQTMAQFPATYDQRYMDFTRLWIDGGVEAIQVDDPDHNTITFTDPWSHQTYRALHFACQSGGTAATVGCSDMTTGGNEAGVAARMLLHIGDMDRLRQNAHNTGDSVGEANWEQTERKYLDLVNVMRSLTQQFGHGTSATP